MRKGIDLLILLVLLGGAGYFAYTHETQVRSLLQFAERKVAPCSSPITYSIGSVDPRFGISKNAFVADIEEAEAIWEKPTGKNLFQYRPQGGAVIVYLVYDARQASVDTLAAAGIQIDKSAESYDALKARYDALDSAVSAEQSAYNAQVARYEGDEAAYNAAVEAANARGGASPAEYDALRSQKAALEAEFAAVKSLEGTMNANIDQLNALATAINQLIVQLNLNVAQYKRAGAAAGEFEEGLYQLKDGVQTIDIYEFSDQAELVRVLAHELGHALGLEHVQDPSAIMYKINSNERLVATAADLAELQRVCSAGI